MRWTQETATVRALFEVLVVSECFGIVICSK